MIRAAQRTTVSFLVGLFLSIAGPAVAGPAVEVTYLANEGFLIEAGAKKILIDALFDGETIDWCHLHSPDIEVFASSELEFDWRDGNSDLPWPWIFSTS